MNQTFTYRMFMLMVSRVSDSSFLLPPSSLFLMARTRSEKVAGIKARITTRLRDGVYRPGDRFLSARELAAGFGVSYQTAHILLDELASEGWLERRAASGTYLPGGAAEATHVQLLYHARARRPQSFGARLLKDLTARLQRDRIHWETAWSDSGDFEIEASAFPVLWEFPAALSQCLATHRPALLLNERPQPGLDAGWIDSVSMNDFSGGVCAAQLLLRDAPNGARFALLSGPENDGRSRARRDGFLSLAKNAAVIRADSWFYEDGLRFAGEAVTRGADGVFCCNDRLAEAVLAFCSQRKIAAPPLIGFDDAPVAERLNLTTIAIPWDEMIAEAVGLIRRRLAGDHSAARQLIVTPAPVIRRL